MNKYTATVRELAEFCYRRGDIDYRYTPSPTAVEGIEGHRQVVLRRPASYQSEYSVQHSVTTDDFTLVLRGRADGYDPQLNYVEEIKTCRVEPAAIPPAVVAVHWAQARLYAAMICQLETERTHLGLQLNYFNVDSGEEFPQRETASRSELLDFLNETLANYCAWLATVHAARRARDASIAALAFPHPHYRRGQRQMAETVYKCVVQGGQLLLQAPTGIGKTAAVLSESAGAGQTRCHLLCHGKNSGQSRRRTNAGPVRARGTETAQFDPDRQRAGVLFPGASLPR